MLNLNIFCVGIIILLFLDLIESATLDPINNFCWRWDHQSAILGDKVYVNGGRELYVPLDPAGGKLLGSKTMGTNNNLFTIDMSTRWDWKHTQDDFVQSEQNRTNKIPTLAAGALWAYEKKNTLYLYGGTQGNMNESFDGFVPVKGDDVMWMYDVTAGSKAKWEPVKLDMAGAGNIPDLSNGASAFVEELGLGFYLGGRVNNRTTREFLVFDVEAGKVKNLTTSLDALPNFTRADGQLVYVPEIGEIGVLVLIGGLYETSPQNQTMISMAEVAIFDLSTVQGDNPKWYIQATSGQLPEGRYDMCAVSVSAQDNSSQNIYMYGGWNNEGHFDDVYALSLPSFVWFKLFQGNDEREAHTCHVVGNRQILTIGGHRSSNPWGWDCDWQLQSVAIFDMTALEWFSLFDHNANAYEIPAEIYRKIGGNSTAGATMKGPQDGWAKDLQAVFVSSKSTMDPSNPPFKSKNVDSGSLSNGKLSNPAIIGVAIGTLMGVTFLLLGIYQIYKFSKLRPKNKSETSQELTGEGPPPIPPKIPRPPRELPSAFQPQVIAELESGWQPGELGEKDRASTRGSMTNSSKTAVINTWI